ncbi:3'(2'),5'-bisphosphate nucleotidase CysQ, partial [Candidatus Pacearchaeota archaeon]|nr:3'(2'),5'-bisphosphate nucleotidase CysQ [Candidatus Pacearchaeota archaeon]
MDNQEFINVEDIINIARKAGKEILKIYKEDYDIMDKEDNLSIGKVISPLTLADLKSNEIISKKLKELYPKIPLISEENKEIPFKTRKEWEYFWLIDPLDGTKEFINKNGEFTINIALVKKNKPVFGLIYVPVKDVFYFTKNKKAYKQKGEDPPIKIGYSKENG